MPRQLQRVMAHATVGAVSVAMMTVTSPPQPAHAATCGTYMAVPRHIIAADSLSDQLLVFPLYGSVMGNHYNQSSGIYNISVITSQQNYLYIYLHNSESISRETEGWVSYTWLC